MIYLLFFLNERVSINTDSGYGQDWHGCHGNICSANIDFVSCRWEEPSWQFH